MTWYFIGLLAPAGALYVLMCRAANFFIFTQSHLFLVLFYTSSACTLAAMPFKDVRGQNVLLKMFILRNVPSSPEILVTIVLVGDCTYLANTGKMEFLLRQRGLASVFVSVYISVFVSVFRGGCT